MSTTGNRSVVGGWQPCHGGAGRIAAARRDDQVQLAYATVNAPKGSAYAVGVLPVDRRRATITSRVPMASRKRAPMMVASMSAPVKAKVPDPDFLAMVVVVVDPELFVPDPV